MSTITRERAQEIFLGNGPEPTASEERELARIVLASLEAEAASVSLKLAKLFRKITNSGIDTEGNAHVVLSPAETLTINEARIALTAPPAPVSVPAAMEMDDDFDSSFEHGKAVGWNAYRAAMLQGADGNSPVIPDGYALVPVEPTAEMQSAAASAIRFDTTPINKLWTGNAVYKAMLAAAPQQEVKP